MNKFIDMFTGETYKEILSILSMSVVLFVPLGIIIRSIYYSFAYDSFDIQLKSKEKRNLITHSKRVAIAFFISFCLTFMYLVFAIIFYKFDWLLIFPFLFIFILVVFLILFSITSLFLPMFKKDFHRTHKGKIKLINFIAIFITFFFIGIFSALLFLAMGFTENPNKFSFHENQILSLFFMLIIGLVTFEAMKSETPKKDIKYMFIGTYKNTIPCDLFFDSIMDSNTHILSSGNGRYKAIKYNTYENDGSYIIELYRKTE